MALATDESQRQRIYRALFKYQVDSKLIENIRQSVNKGMAIGSVRFKQEIAALTGRQMTEKKRGRPVGWRKAKV